MRGLPIAALAIALSAFTVSAQQQKGRFDAGLRADIERLGRDPLGALLPPLDSVTLGDRSVAAGTTASGSVAVARGNLDVFGAIAGDAVAVYGDVIVHRGGIVRGNAVSLGGLVRLDGGEVYGDMRSLSGSLVPVAFGRPRVSAFAATKRSVELALGWLAILAFIGIGVLMFAGSYLDGVVEALESRFMRSFWIGLAGEVALAPGIALMVVGLAITILGILLIPFAIVAASLAAAGLITLGFLAISRVTGAAFQKTPASITARGATLRALMLGLLVYSSLWVAAALFTWNPMVATVLRCIAMAITWVAATAGFGAAIISRGGSRRHDTTSRPARIADDHVAWQTPTPVSGVAAARRPTPAYTSKDLS